MKRRHKIFISYRHSDSSTFSNYLKNFLELNFGKSNVFLDVNIPKGNIIPRYINSELNKTKLMIVVIGKNWATVKDLKGKKRLFNRLDPVKYEIEYAISHKISILPIYVDDSDTLKIHDVPRSINCLPSILGKKINQNEIELSIKNLVVELEIMDFQVVNSLIRWPQPIVITKKPLSKIKIEEELKKIKGWTIVNRSKLKDGVDSESEIRKVYYFKNFIDAMKFMENAQPLITKLNHHPDWRNVYSDVEVWLTTFDLKPKRLSKFDFDLAVGLDKLYESFYK